VSPEEISFASELGGLRLDRLLARRKLRESRPGTCVDHTGSGDALEPNYRECTRTLSDGSELNFLLSINYHETRHFCALLDGKPCRGSSYCENGNAALDCRNLLSPVAPCAAVDCDGNCVPSLTDAALEFDYSDNECARLGYYCVDVSYDTDSCCTWLRIIPDETVVRVVTDEGPSDSYGNPEGAGYSGDCYARADNGEDEAHEMEICDGCEITGIGLGGNYAHFDSATRPVREARSSCLHKRTRPRPARP
jgi:hypothetical protein